MQQMNCPKCGAPAEYGSRFCSNCGNSLQGGAPPPPPYGYQPPPNQPQPWGQPQQYSQQPGWNQPPPPYNRAPPTWAGPRQSQQGYRGAMPQQKKSSMSIILLIILIVVIFTIGGLALATNGFSSSKPSSDTTASTTPKTPATTPPAETTPPATVPLATPPPAAPPAPALPTSDATQVTAAELISAYANDSLGATSKYQGNVYAISGTVTSVNSSSPPFLYLGEASAGALEIQCSFSQGQEGTISMFEVGNKVKVEGRITNYNRAIIVVDHCRLVQ